MDYEFDSARGRRWIVTFGAVALGRRFESGHALSIKTEAEMAEIHKCEREGCRTIERMGRGWWGVTLADGEAKLRPYEPGMARRSDEKFVCGEGCMTRSLAVWSAKQQKRSSELRRQESEIAALETLMREA